MAPLLTSVIGFLIGLEYIQRRPALNKSGKEAANFRQQN